PLGTRLRQGAPAGGTFTQPGAWRWGSGLGAPTREGTPKHATGTCACPSQLRASESAFVAPSRVKRPPPRPPAPRSLVQTFPWGLGGGCPVIGACTSTTSVSISC